LNSFQTPAKLFGFFVQCVGLAEPAVFLDLHPVRMRFLVFRSVVVTLLAFCTC